MLTPNYGDGEGAFGNCLRRSTVANGSRSRSFRGGGAIRVTSTPANCWLSYQISFINLLRAISTRCKQRLSNCLRVVALLEDKPADRLLAGQVGTVVELLAPDAFEVEFLDSK